MLLSLYYQHNFQILLVCGYHMSGTHFSSLVVMSLENKQNWFQVSTTHEVEQPSPPSKFTSSQPIGNHMNVVATCCVAYNWVLTENMNFELYSPTNFNQTRDTAPINALGIAIKPSMPCKFPFPQPENRLTCHPLLYMTSHVLQNRSGCIHLDPTDFSTFFRLAPLKIAITANSKGPKWSSWLAPSTPSNNGLQVHMGNGSSSRWNSDNGIVQCWIDLLVVVRIHHI